MQDQPIQDIFAQINGRLNQLNEEFPEKIDDVALASK